MKRPLFPFVSYEPKNGYGGKPPLLYTLSFCPGKTGRQTP